MKPSKNRRLIKSYIIGTLARVIDGDQGVGAGYLYDSGFSFDPETVDDIVEDIKQEFERRGEFWDNADKSKLVSTIEDET